jgi:3-methyl-2-oxobutanoate hydroxymethyltransferase
VQGRSLDSQKALVDHALQLQEAGAFSLVLEAVPMGLAKEITEKLGIPTIGIGGGPHCDGQILVLHDVLGLFERFLPKFAKRYANLKAEAVAAIRKYREEVEQEIFPSEKESFQ